MTLKKLSVRLVLGILALSIFASPAQSTKENPQDGAAQAELERLEKVWNEAHVTGDPAALDALWAEELVVTVPKMPLFNKAQSLAIWRSGKLKMKRYDTSDLGFHIMGDTAVVTGALIRERAFNGKEVRDDWRFTKVYLRRDSKWRVVAWHASDAPTPSAAQPPK